MKKFLALILIALCLTAALCGCGSKHAPSPSGSTPTASDSTPASSLPGTFEIAATDPHYILSTPDWRAESYGLGFTLNEKGSRDYAIVVACGEGEDGASLEDDLAALYHDTFQDILKQNYRATYAEFIPDSTTEGTLSDGSSALRFEGVQSADDYGTELNCPVYGYSFRHNGTPFIVACIVMNESAADAAKIAEMKGYVNEMVNTVRTAK